MAKTAIQIDHLQITYNPGQANEYKALNNVVGEIYPREYIILFGPSGCGKSTLLYTILGGIVPVGGHMWVRGEDIYAYTAAEMNHYQQSTIGIVYQQFNLVASLNVLDNVALPRLFLSKTVAERNARAKELLRRFGIPERVENKLPALMSGGQQQRVAVARALVNDPEILLADEPVGNLDSISAEHVMESFDEINQKDRKTVILVTHDAKYLPYAHRVFYMRDGALRRVVVNPGKPQVKRVKPGETIVTEIEQLARLYPYDEPINLKVKSVVNYATQTMSFSQLERLEEAILLVLKGSMDEAMFGEFLMLRIGQGGLGLLEDAAKEMVRRIFALMKYSRDVARFREGMHADNVFVHQQQLVDNLIEFVIHETGVQMNDTQLAVMRLAVTERVGGIINAEDFEQRLTLTPELGGAYLGEREAAQITRYLEKLIAQGGYVIRPNELLGGHT